MSSAATAPAASRGWDDASQRRLHLLAGVPPTVSINGVPRPSPRRYLIHPILAMGGWASYRADGLGKSYGERAFGVEATMRMHNSPMEAVEAHLVKGLRGPFDPWVIRSSVGLGQRHHYAMSYVLLETAQQMVTMRWTIDHLERFMADPKAVVAVTTGRKGLRQITGSKTYEEGRAVIQDLFGLTVSQPSFSSRRRVPNRIGDEINLSWTNKRIIEGTTEAFTNGSPTFVDGREVNTVSIGYTGFLVANPQVITVAKDLIPWLWSTAQALRRKSIDPLRLLERMDDEDSIMRRQAILWDALAPTDEWKVRSLITSEPDEQGFLTDVFGPFTRKSWHNAAKRFDNRDQKAKDEPVGPMFPGETIGSTMAPRLPLGEEPLVGDLEVMQIADEMEFRSLGAGPMDTEESPYFSTSRGAEVMPGSQVMPETSQVMPEVETHSQVRALSGEPLNQAVVKTPSESPCFSRPEGAEVMPGSQVMPETSQVMPQISQVMPEISKVMPEQNITEGSTSALVVEEYNQSENTTSAPKDSNITTSAQGGIVDQIAPGISKVMPERICNQPDGTTSAHENLLQAIQYPQASKQGIQEDLQTTGDLLACLPAGDEKNQIETLKGRTKGLSGMEIQSLLQQGVLGSWAASDPHERKCAVKLICSLVEEGARMGEEVVLRLLSEGLLTARGAWAMAMTLRRTRTRSGITKAICDSPHMMVRNWSQGNFARKDGEQNGYAKDFFNICDSLSVLGWREFTSHSGTNQRERDAIYHLHRNDAAGIPLPEEARQEQAQVAAKRAQEAREALRPAFRAPESFLASEDDRRLLLDLKGALTLRMEAESNAYAVVNAARLERRGTTPEEKLLVKEAANTNALVDEALRKTGPIAVPGGVARHDDKTQWRALLTVLERIL